MQKKQRSHEESARGFACKKSRRGNSWRSSGIHRITRQLQERLAPLNAVQVSSAIRVFSASLKGQPAVVMHEVWVLLRRVSEGRGASNFC